MLSLAQVPRILIGRIALCLSVLAGVSGLPALAADTGNGSKNFHVPATVPNFFSNEAGPMLGGAAESRRGELYGGPRAAALPPQRSHVAVAAVPRHAAPVVIGRGRSRSLAHRPGGGRQYAAHTKQGTHVAAHSKAGTHHVAARTSGRPGPAHAAAKTTRVGSNHRHGRG